jgi:hypothetical protein
MSPGLMGNGARTIARPTQVDRKTVRRYVDAARVAGLSPGDPEDKLTDEVLGDIEYAGWLQQSQRQRNGGKPNPVRAVFC